MTKADIVARVYGVTTLSKMESYEVVEEVFELLKATLENGQNIKVSGFGNFEVRQKAPRRGRNPQTGESLVIDARRVLSFKPSAVLKDLLNGG